MDTIMRTPMGGESLPDCRTPIVFNNNGSVCLCRFKMMNE